jgi:hypothetical protein
MSWKKNSPTSFPIYTDVFPSESVVGYEYLVLDDAESNAEPLRDGFADARFIFTLIQHIPLPKSATSCLLRTAPAGAKLTQHRETPEAKLYIEQDIHSIDMALDTCCGYTAPIFVFYISIFIMYLRAHRCTEFVNAYKENLIEPFLQTIKNKTGSMSVDIKTPDIFTGILEDKIINVNGPILAQYCNNFYKLISPYCRTKDPVTKKRIHASSQFMTCVKGFEILRPGVNLVTLYSGAPQSSSCSSHHHFFAYVSGKFVVISDTWLGGCYGSRTTWRRIMRLNHFSIILNELSKGTDPAVRTELIKQYFYAPAFQPGRIPECTEEMMKREKYDIPYSEPKPLHIYSINSIDQYSTQSTTGINYNDNLFTRIIRYSFFDKPQMRSLHRQSSFTASEIEEKTSNAIAEDLATITTPAPAPPPEDAKGRKKRTRRHKKNSKKKRLTRKKINHLRLRRIPSYV